jgi:hypothetical protein
MNLDASGAQQTDVHTLASIVPDVHTIPFGEVDTLPVPLLATVTNNNLLGDQQTDAHPLASMV